MKKVMCLFITVLLLSSLSSVFADEVKLNDLSFQELIALREEIDKELVQRTVITDHSDYTLDGFLYLSNGSEVHIKYYEGTNPNIVIPAEIDGLPVTEIHPEAFQDNGTIETVVVSEGITELPTEFLRGCTNLTSVTLPEGIKEIPDYCFANCKKLANLSLPSTVTKIGFWPIKNTQIKTLIFHEGIEEIDSFQDTELEGVIILPTTLKKMESHAFGICDNTTGFIIQSDVTVGESCMTGPNVKFIYVKEGCNVAFEDIPFSSSLRTAILPASVTSIDDEVFSPCNLLTIVCPAGSYAESYAKSHFLMCDTEHYDQYVQEYDTEYLQK